MRGARTGSGVVCALIVAFAMIVAPRAFGAGSTLKNVSQPVLWAGTVVAGGGSTSEVPECQPGCQRFDLQVDLPDDVWAGKAGGVQVAIRWAGRTLADNLKLYVYRGGSLVAKSEGIISTAQSLLIPSAANGLYQIYAVFDPDAALSDSIAYDGLAEVEYAPKVSPVRPLLPDLTVRPQRNLTFDPGGIFFDEISSAHPTCYQSEVAEEGAQLCLRFDQIFANVGEGPMQLRFAVPSGETPPAVTASQRVFWSDGAAHYQDRVAGDVELHQAHGHYHFESFGISSLWAVDADGNAIGSTPLRQRRRSLDTLVRNGRKVSFCMADIYIDAWAAKGDGARTYNAPDCLFPASSDGGSDQFVQGITNGWADVYDWYLPDQYMEVTGVPDGVYLLQTVVDPDGALVEASESNNCGGVYIRLSNMGSPVPQATLIGPARACTSTRR
jgi:hypothetical protein